MEEDQCLGCFAGGLDRGVRAGGELGQAGHRVELQPGGGEPGLHVVEQADRRERPLRVAAFDPVRQLRWAQPRLGRHILNILSGVQQRPEQLTVVSFDLRGQVGVAVVHLQGDPATGLCAQGTCLVDNMCLPN